NNVPRVWNILQPKSSLDNNENEIFYTYDESKGKYYHLLHDKGNVGVFMKGFFGYNSDPNYVELILWILSMLFGIRMWSSFYRAS
ncbi:MAG: hypothetical protein MK242_03980, partial [Hyphomicrobiales bacterium]|nr:hypothetical protein [Hyphomicrobiales bacterium]